jgi:hypothetical protein
MKRNQKVRQIEDFIDRYLQEAEGRREERTEQDSISIVAQSPGSPVAVALESRLSAIASAGFEVSAIFAVPAPDAVLDRWLSSIRTVRWARDQRLREAHEQLVLGRSGIWVGDSMRREAAKTDLFEQYCSDCMMTVLLGHRAFRALQSACVALQPRRETAKTVASAVAPVESTPCQPETPPPVQGVDPVAPGSVSAIAGRVLTRH